MANAILITGNTYPARRELRAAGCLFDRDETGYIVAADNAKAREIAEERGLDVEAYDATEEQLTPATGDRLRTIRQDRIDRRVDRLNDRADRAEARADKIRATRPHHENDWAFITQPIMVGHHSEGRHRNMRKAMSNRIDREMTERTNAAELRSKADWQYPARVKGDADRSRNKAIDKARDEISNGDLVNSAIYGECIVIKVNTKTARVKMERSGSVFPVPLNFLTLIEKREPVRVEPQFKKGDLVTVSTMGGKHPGVILRRTPSAYSVKFHWHGRVEDKRTFAECYLTPRAA